MIDVTGRVDPKVVEPRFETVDHVDIVGEVHDLVGIVGVWDCGAERIGTVIRSAEFNDVLAGKQHHLPVRPAGTGAANRNARVPKLVEDDAIERLGGVCPEIRDDARADRPGTRDQRVSVALVLHEPEGRVDTHRLVPNQVQQRRPAILEGRIAKTFGGMRRPAEKNPQRDRGSSAYHRTRSLDPAATNKPANAARLHLTSAAGQSTGAHPFPAHLAKSVPVRGCLKLTQIALRRFARDVHGIVVTLPWRKPKAMTRMQGSRDPAGTGSMAHGPSSMNTVGVFARKGFWLPLPSFEFGVGAVHLADSRIWTGQVYTKLAVHEGYTKLPLPSIAARGAVSRMFTQRELDLTIASFDLMLSKHFGIADTWRLDPFAGWNLLMIVPRSEVIDPTPHIDPLEPGNAMDSQLSFVFRDQDTIFRNRFMVGVKLQYYVVQLTLEAAFATSGSSVDDQPGTTEKCGNGMAETTACDSDDRAAGQRTLSMSAGFDF